VPFSFISFDWTGQTPAATTGLTAYVVFPFFLFPAATPVTLQGLQGLQGCTPWRTRYNLYSLKVARSKQGIAASLSLTCSNTA